MKSIFISIFFIFLFHPISTSTKNAFKSFQLGNATLERSLEENSKQLTNFDNYIHLIYEIFKALDPSCYEVISNEIDSSFKKNIENDKNYPWILDYIGKGLNDLGDEIECKKSLKNTTFLISQINTLAFVYKNDTSLMKFLEIGNFTFGICIMNTCRESFIYYFERILKIIDYIAINNDQTSSQSSNNIIDFQPDQGVPNEISYNIIIILLIYIILKLIVGLFRLILIPKGYDKYVAGLLQEQGKFDNIDIDEKKSFFEKNNNNEVLLNEEVDYYPFFDLGSYYPIKIRIFKFFDFFNDFTLLTTKRNRYFNDNGLEIINFMKVMVIFFLVFYCTFYALVSLPSKDIFNKKFFTSYLLFIYKLSINSLNWWTMLEGAYTTNKLINFIKAQMFESYIINKKKPKIEIQLFIIYAKFILLFIPKTLVFFIIYYLFYYNVEGFRHFLQSEKTFDYIIDNTFKKGIKCSASPLSIFNFNIFSRNIEDYYECYEFTYIYFNIIISTLIFMIIIYLSFLFRNKIFEIFMIIINLVLFFVSVLLIKDKKVSNGNEKLNYTYYHFVGQKYSTRVLYSLIGFYHLGYILGFLIFHYENNKYKYKYKLNKKKENPGDVKKITNNKNNDIESNKLNEDINIAGDLNSNNNNGINAEIIVNYYPLSFFNKFLFWLNNIKPIYKRLVIYICIILMIMFSLSIVIYIKYYHSDFVIELNSSIKYLFLYEKHIFILLFFIINLMLITHPKKRNFQNIINSGIFIAIGRIGFTIICLCVFLSYLCFCNYFIKVKFHIPTFVLISIGNFLIIFIACFSFNIIFEIPLRILVKKLIRKNIKK